VQREQVLGQALQLLEQQGLKSLTLQEISQQINIPLAVLTPFWPDYEALLYDCLRHHGEQIAIWRRQIWLDTQLSTRQKMLARYHILAQQVQQQRYPGCLFIAACSCYPDSDHPIHQLAEQQKQASYLCTLTLLQEMEIDDCETVAQQMELVLEGCLSKLLVKRQAKDIDIALRLAEDILQIACCRKHGALG
jgi:AcrR family transcriptional regulator